MRALPLALLVAHASLTATSPAVAEGARVNDVGIFGDLDAGVKIALPPRLDSARIRLRLDDRHALLVLFDGELAVKAYALVRAYRNAGIDLQRRVADDIQAAPAAYPWVTRPNASIDHRRVKTLLTWFQRHVPEVRGQAPRAGDVVFLDTFAGRPGPDHVGIISDRVAPSGLPYVINNWTVGYREGEMDLLPSVPVTHLFRMK